MNTSGGTGEPPYQGIGENTLGSLGYFSSLLPCPSYSIPPHPGLYIGWRCPHYLWDCFRIGDESKCFCGHLLREHQIISGREN